MTRKEAAELSPIIQAFSEGKPIQYRIKDNESAVWTNVDRNYHTFSPHSFQYRIKPETNYRPFKNAEECWQEMLKHHPFGWVVGRRDGVMYLIRSLEYVSVYTSIQYSFKDAFDKFEFADLVPFGVKEEE